MSPQAPPGEGLATDQACWAHARRCALVQIPVTRVRRRPCVCSRPRSRGHAGWPCPAPSLPDGCRREGGRSCAPGASRPRSAAPAGARAGGRGMRRQRQRRWGQHQRCRRVIRGHLDDRRRGDVPRPRVRGAGSRSSSSVESGAKINYQAIGSGGGIEQLQKKTVDFGASDAPLQDPTSAGVQRPQDPGCSPRCWAAWRSPTTSPTSPTRIKLDGPTVADIFLGKVKNWNDPGSPT